MTGRLPLAPALVVLAVGLLGLGTVLVGATVPAAPSMQGHPLIGASQPPGAHSTPAATPSASPVLGQSGLSPASISLNWTASSVFGLSGYTVNLSASGASGPWSTVGTTGSAATGLGVGGLSPGGTYWWQVIASGFVGATQTSNVLQVAQPGLAALSAPSNTTTSVSLQWTNAAAYGGSVGFVNYTIYESSNRSVPTPVATLTPASALSHTVNGLASGTGYSFYVNTTDCYAGCGGGTPTSSVTESNTVTVGTPQPLAATASAQHSIIDVGQPDLFSCAPAGGVSPFLFSWNPGTGTFAPGPSSESFSFNSPGFVLVSCRVTDAHSSTYTSPMVNVTVNAYPTLSVGANRTAADAGEPIALTCTPSDGTAPLVAAWTFGDGTNPGPATTTHAYTASGSYEARCTVADRVGGMAAASLSLNITPALGATIGVNSLTAAPGTNLSFVAGGLNGSGTYTSYHWAFGDGATGVGRTPLHAYQQAGTFTVGVVVDDSYGTTAAVTTSLHISLVADRVATTPAKIDTGTSVTFSATAAGGAGAPYNFTWKFGDGTTGYGATASHRFTGTGDRWPTLTVRDHLGATNVTPLPVISVVNPPSPYGWLTAGVLLLLAALVALVFGIVTLVRRRRSDSERASAEGLGRWIPPVGPSRLTRGTRICPACGAANLPIRHTCHACGRDLPRRTSK